MTRKDNYASMRLRAGNDKEKLDIILQNECRDRAARKLPETLRCSSFRFPTALSAEQCTGDELASEHVALAGSCDTVLDMTCGLGIDAFHMARRSRSVTMIDMDPVVAAAARSNSNALGFDNIEVICADSVDWLRKNNRSFDLIFIDPARRGAGNKRLYSLADCSPDVIEILELLRSRCRKLIIKASPMLDIKSTFDELGLDTDIVLYGSASECKELVAVIPGSGKVSVKTSGDSDFCFTMDDEASAIVEICQPCEGAWLYEPSAALMKSGAFKLAGERFGLKKFDVNTHLYWSDVNISGFPGSHRRIIGVYRFSKQLSGLIAGNIAEGQDVAVRNFVMTAAELSKRLGVIKGGDGRRRLYGVRSCGEKLIVLTESTD